MRGDLENLRDRLLRGDPDVFGDAPHWIAYEVRDKITLFLEQHSGTISAEDAWRFLLGGIRFVADSDSRGECDALGDALFEVFEKAKRSIQK